MGNLFARFLGETFLTFRPPFGVDRRRRDLEGEAVIDWSRVSIIKYLSIQSRISAVKNLVVFRTSVDNNSPESRAQLSGSGYDKNNGRNGQLQRHLPKGALLRNPYLLDR